ncbi:Endo-1,4-beta-xylanase A precursor [compost metagenome]
MAASSSNDSSSSGSGGGSSSTSSGSSTGSASDKLTATINQAAVNQAIQNQSNGTITLNVNAGSGINQITVDIPLSTLANLDSSITHVKLQAGDVSVTLPVEVLKSYIDNKTKNIQWIITKVANTANRYSVVLNADGKQVTTLSKPAQIELAYSLQSGQTPEKLIIRQWNEAISQIIMNSKYNSKSGVMQFATSTLGTFSIDYRNVSFNDIAKLTWAKLSIESLASKGIVTGVTEDKFNPSSNVTRAEFLTLLMRTFGLTNSEAQATFSDTPSSAWYYSYVASAQSLGIVNGSTDGKFNPNAQISRQDMAVMTYQLLTALQISLANGNQQAYADADQISGYALEAIRALSQAGIMQGNNNNFAPKGSATRAEAAVLIYNLIK